MAARKDPLADYNAKRDFALTPEPAGKRASNTKGNRFMNIAGAGGSPIADDLLSLSAVLTNPEMSVILHALQQRGHTDLLSAPKITTQSGQQATIKVVTEYIYPTECRYTLC